VKLSSVVSSGNTKGSSGSDRSSWYLAVRPLVTAGSLTKDDRGSGR
jgi:hypothetical protein